MRIYSNLALILVSGATLSISACAPMDPTFMPAGYQHHQKDYKSPPGPKPTPIVDESQGEAERYNP